MTRVLIPVDIVWSYNYIGGLEGTMDVNTAVLADLFGLAADYVRHWHNFQLSRDNIVWNLFAEHLNMRLVSYPCHPTYSISYFRMLYNSLRLGLTQVPSQIQSIQVVNNAQGDVEAFVLSCITTI
jgi:hypothetical protein